MSAETRPMKTGHTTTMQSLHDDSLRTQAVRAIRGAIITGELEPGSVHSARALAERLGVSVTPVREAMVDLASEGLVTVVRNRGFKVTLLSQGDLDEILQLRVLLEVPVVGAVARQEIGAADHTSLAAICAEIEQSAKTGDLAGFLEADRRFHGGLTDLFGNGRITLMVSQLRDQTRLYGLSRLVRDGQLQESAAEHAAILAAVTAGNKQSAERLTHKHLRHTRGIWAGLTEPEAPDDDLSATIQLLRQERHGQAGAAGERAGGS
jgi:DNA-binding GntR family transcriptional regulator